MLTKDSLIRLCKAREQLQDSDLANFSINEVAKSAAMSRYHFIRQFKNVFGETPIRFRQRVRLDRARHMLVHGEELVTSICMAVGFPSLGRLSVSSRRLRRAIANSEKPGVVNSG